MATFLWHCELKCVLDRIERPATSLLCSASVEKHHHSHPNHVILNSFKMDQTWWLTQFPWNRDKNRTYPYFLPKFACLLSNHRKRFFVLLFSECAQWMECFSHQIKKAAYLEKWKQYISLFARSEEVRSDYSSSLRRVWTSELSICNQISHDTGWYLVQTTWQVWLTTYQCIFSLPLQTLVNLATSWFIDITLGPLIGLYMVNG